MILSISSSSYVFSFASDGTLLQVVGTKGKAGSSLNPLQFGNVADADGDSTVMFVSDGDGGVNNRVLAMDPLGQRVLFVMGGAAPSRQAGQFNSPHSVAYFPQNKLVFVADRGNNRTEVFSSAGGHYLGEWTCTRPGTPWGVRAWGDQNLLFVAEGTGQLINILDLSTTSPTAAGPCSVLASVDVDPTLCETPHEMALDTESGEIYVACIGSAHGTVRRFKQECRGALRACL
jgi:DNA-binding beta-propeller fold protein YncE